MVRHPVSARALLPILSVLALAGCVTTPKPPPPAHVEEPARDMHAAGLQRVMGKDARALIALLGQPDQDRREDRARRLQFVGAACVLDAYLYPPASGGEPVVTWIDARTKSGDDMDRASCIAALVRR